MSAVEGTLRSSVQSWSFSCAVEQRTFVASKASGLEMPVVQEPSPSPIVGNPLCLIPLKPCRDKFGEMGLGSLCVLNHSFFQVVLFLADHSK